MVIWNWYRVLKIYSLHMYPCPVWLWKGGLRYWNTLYIICNIWTERPSAGDSTCGRLLYKNILLIRYDLPRYQHAWHCQQRLCACIFAIYLSISYRHINRDVAFWPLWYISWTRDLCDVIHVVLPCWPLWWHTCSVAILTFVMTYMQCCDVDLCDITHALLSCWPLWCHTCSVVMLSFVILYVHCCHVDLCGVIHAVLSCWPLWYHTCSVAMLTFVIS